jgi:hypothetical protein
MQPAAEVEDVPLRGPTHRFADPIAPEVPDSGAGIYTVRDERTVGVGDGAAIRAVEPQPFRNASGSRMREASSSRSHARRAAPRGLPA